MNENVPAEEHSFMDCVVHTYAFVVHFLRFICFTAWSQNFPQRTKRKRYEKKMRKKKHVVIATLPMAAYVHKSRATQTHLHFGPQNSFILLLPMIVFHSWRTKRTLKMWLWETKNVSAGGTEAEIIKSSRQDEMDTDTYKREHNSKCER